MVVVRSSRRQNPRSDFRETPYKRSDGEQYRQQKIRELKHLSKTVTSINAEQRALRDKLEEVKQIAVEQLGDFHSENAEVIKSMQAGKALSPTAITDVDFLFGRYLNTVQEYQRIKQIKFEIDSEAYAIRKSRNELQIVVQRQNRDR
uniref:Uncharacterized protein n=1 Tax=Panagrolaimus davidi TaxID=227884 RepID=A0A914QYQ4_9BILA